MNKYSIRHFKDYDEFETFINQNYIVNKYFDLRQESSQFLDEDDQQQWLDNIASSLSPLKCTLLYKRRIRKDRNWALVNGLFCHY